MTTLRMLFEEFCASAGKEGDDAALAERVAEFCSAAGYVPDVTPLKVLRRARLDVKEIIDVGVFRGTPFLYNAFPDCEFLLVDPQRNAESLLTQKPRLYKFANVALGAAEGEMTLSALASCSTLKTWSDGPRANPVERYPVKVTTLDALIARELKSDRIGIKIDAKGFEDQVIRGLDKALPRVRFVTVEMSIKRRFDDAPYFSDIVALMLEKGFFFYNLMNSLGPVPGRYCDALFLPKDDERFSAAPPKSAV